MKVLLGLLIIVLMTLLLPTLPLHRNLENNISVFLLQARAADCCMARDSSVVFCGLGENVEEVLSLNIVYYSYSES